MNIAAIKAEISGAAYQGLDDVQIADKLNEQVVQVDRDTLTGGDIAAAISRAEYGALSALDKQYVQMLVMAPSLPVTANLKAELGAVFGSGTGTRQRLVALIKRAGTRGEELGHGHVTPSNVADARRSS